jgi:hypothetical protein
MKPLQLSVPGRLLALWLAMVAVTLSFTVAQAGCEFVVVKQQIDLILDRDSDKAAKFRREVSSGSDSITVIEWLVSPEMSEKIDICRFETGEYLTKRGFPPFH